jgi:hypothetical protein
MVWRQLICFDDCQCHQFWLRFDDEVPNFQPTLLQKLAWLDTNGPAGACITLEDHFSQLCRGYSMVRRQLIWFDDCQCHQFWLRFDDEVPNFQPTSALKLGHGLSMSPMGQQEPASLFNITHQIHMEDIEWSGGN